MQVAGGILSQRTYWLITEAQLTTTIGSSEQERLFSLTSINPNNVFRDFRLIQQRKYEWSRQPRRDNVHRTIGNSRLDVVFDCGPMEQRKIIYPDKTLLHV